MPGSGSKGREVRMSDSTVEVQERAAQNQTLFREVNERVGKLTETLNRVTLRNDWICECANTECFEPVELSIEEYEALRLHPARFAVFPGDTHVVPEAERIVERTDRYWVVEKIEVAGRIATENDPRA
jgi:hypothetical protein